MDAKTIHERLEREISRKESAMREAQSLQTKAFLSSDIETMAELSGDLLAGCIEPKYVVDRCRIEFDIDLAA